MLAAVLLLAICAIGIRLVTAGPAAAPATAPATSAADAEEFAALIGLPNHVLIDVRTPAEHAAGYLQGTDKLIDFDSPDFSEKLGQLPRDKTYLIYCRSGRRSGLAASEMSSLGFQHVIHLQGGVQAWQKASKPLIK